MDRLVNLSRWGRVSRRQQSLLGFATIFLVGCIGTACAQQRIGKAEIVIDGVQGALPTGVTTPVVQGDGVYRDEGVRTLTDSRAGLLMEDETHVTVGPSSLVKLDQFVYPGPKKAGAIVLNLSKGTFRVVIGNANKNAYTILTPTGAIGVRD